MTLKLNAWIRTNRDALIILFLISALMVNLGYGENLALALQCEQYYLEYLLFMVLAYGTKILIDVFEQKVSFKNPFRSGFLIGSTAALLIYPVLLGYCIVTNCPFDSVLYLTTRAPLIISIVILYQYWKGAKHKTDTTTDQKAIELSLIGGGMVRISTQTIQSIDLENGLTSVIGESNRRVLVGENLKSVFDKLNNSEEFFRVNRSSIVAKMAIVSYKPEKNNNLRIELVDGRHVSLNKNKASDFKCWMNSV